MDSGSLPAESQRPFGTGFPPRAHAGTARGSTPPRRLSDQLPALRCYAVPAAPAAAPQPGSERFTRSSKSRLWLRLPNSSVHRRPCFRSRPTLRTTVAGSSYSLHPRQARLSSTLQRTYTKSRMIEMPKLPRKSGFSVIMSPKLAKSFSVV